MTGDEPASSAAEGVAPKRFPTVGIGTSEGGVQALRAFFETLPDDVAAAFVVVVHLDPAHQSELSNILAARTRMPVTQVVGRVRLEPSHVYVIPPNRQLLVSDQHLSIAEFEEPSWRRAPIDLFFRSLAARSSDDFAIILSGAGSDGSVGITAVKEAGGVILLQDPEEAEYGSMPRAAVATGLADFILPVREIAARLSELVRTRENSLSGRLIGGDAQALGEMSTASIDIAQRAPNGKIQQLQQELQFTQSQLRAVINGVADAIITTDERGTIQAVNAATTALFGYSEKELIGRKLGEIVPEPTHQEGQRAIERYLRNAEGSLAAVSREVEGRRTDGSSFPTELTVSEIRHGDERLFIALVRDLSERRRFEAQLNRLHSNRLDSMAKLAAALAHEINQPLAAAANYMSAARNILSARQPANDAADEALDKAAAQMVRAGQIISHLREFMARGEPDKVEQSLHALIQRTIELVAPSAKAANVEIDLTLNAGEDMVLADLVQVEQAMVNIIRNAIEVMSHSSNRRLVISTSLENGMIRAEFADTGPGLTPSANAELFVPFTSNKSNGLGVGLSISRSIIEAHYGTIWAEANPGGGARFCFTLPLARLESVEK